MKIGDRVESLWNGRTGVITSEAFYKGKEIWDDEEFIKSDSMQLCYRVEYDREKEPVIEYAYDLALENTPHVAEYMQVQISMYAKMYWGMKGIVVGVCGSSVTVRLYGYENPVLFDIDDIEPLTHGTNLSCWLDTI